MKSIKKVLKWKIEEEQRNEDINDVLKPFSEVLGQLDKKAGEDFLRDCEEYVSKKFDVKLKCKAILYIYL